MRLLNNEKEFRIISIDLTHVNSFMINSMERYLLKIFHNIYLSNFVDKIIDDTVFSIPSIGPISSSDWEAAAWIAGFITIEMNVAEWCEEINDTDQTSNKILNQDTWFGVDINSYNHSQGRPNPFRLIFL